MRTTGKAVHPHETLAGSDESGASPLALGGGTLLGRYRVLHKVGAGSSGVVLAALDPQLGRTVAIKVLRAESERARADLEREARALARLAHPNVVSVLDVGEHRGSVFVAMELVEGTTLDVWLLEETPSPHRVLEVFDQIGLGLAAAHAAGIVHRDVKPQNVMIDADGRVRVMDFGLAADVDAGDTTGHASASFSPPVRAPSSSARAPSLSRTQGTPAYMAPEQWLRRPASDKADQFAYCVALYEALWGLHPFGYEFHAMPRLIAERGATTPPRTHVRTGAAVPRALVSVVLRGLAYEPDDRHPSMEALLAALRASRHRGKRSLLIVGVGAGAGVGLLLALLAGSGGDARCEGASAKLDGVWDPSIRATVGDALRATATPYSEHTAARVIEELDRYSQEWTAAYTAACEAAGTQSAEARELQMQCLLRHRQRLHARVDALQRADGRVVERAVEAVTGLPPVEACDDPGAVASTIPRPADAAAAARVDRLHGELAEIDALVATGAYNEARERLDAAALGVAATEYAPLRVEVALHRSRLAGMVGARDEQAEAATAAYFEAVALGMDREAVRAAETVAFADARRPGSVEEGFRWAARARASLQRLPGSQPRLEAMIESTLGVLHHANGDLDTASEHMERALEILAPDDRQADTPLSNYADVLITAHEFERAAELAERALKIARAELGPEHPGLTPIMDNLAVARWKLGRNEEAAAILRDALRIRERAFGEGQRHSFALLANLAAIELDSGHHQAALDSFVRAREALEEEGREETLLMGQLLINQAQVQLELEQVEDAENTYALGRRLWETLRGRDDPDFGYFYEILGRIRSAQGREDEAIAALQDALAHYRRTVGDDSPRLAHPHRLLGGVEHDRGHWDAAVEHHRQALAIHERSLGAGHLETARDLRNIGRVLQVAGRTSEAVPALEQALAMLEQLGQPPLAALATTRLYLAEARAALGRPRSEIEPLAASARDALADDPLYADEHARAASLLSTAD